ncbi:MAG: hypothetical protein Q4F29_00485, partial [Lachnospiraceae bacterium]|nr:hypothetical protein [Lachnospiraceae bacterium]
EKFQDNEIKRKYLGRYEVPLELEESTSELHGFINVMHLREIDRKRIDSRKIGIVTKQCFEKVIHAVIENLHPGY